MSQDRYGIVVTGDNVLAVLGKELRVRIVNCSPSGCLVETNSRMTMNRLVPMIGPNSVPAPPTIAHTTASPDT